MIKNCLICKKVFIKKINYSIKNWVKAKYCSLKCRGIGDRGKPGYWLGKKRDCYWMKGNKNHTWKGGITGKDDKERLKFRRTMQKLIFERDNYSCKNCGKRGRDLQVDHIQSWAKFKELRFDFDNCRTLCDKCHYRVTFNKEMPKDLKEWGYNSPKGGISL